MRLAISLHLQPASSVHPESLTMHSRTTASSSMGLTAETGTHPVGWGSFAANAFIKLILAERLRQNDFSLLRQLPINNLLKSSIVAVTYHFRMVVPSDQDNLIHKVRATT